MMKREPSHREVKQTFQKRPGLTLINIYDEETKKVRMKETDKKNSNNVRCHMDQLIVKEGQIASLTVKE